MDTATLILLGIGAYLLLKQTSPPDLGTTATTPDLVTTPVTSDNVSAKPGAIETGTGTDRGGSVRSIDTPFGIINGVQPEVSPPVALPLTPTPIVEPVPVIHMPTSYGAPTAPINSPAAQQYMSIQQFVAGLNPLQTEYNTLASAYYPAYTSQKTGYPSEPTITSYNLRSDGVYDIYFSNGSTYPISPYQFDEWISLAQERVTILRFRLTQAGG